MAGNWIRRAAAGAAGMAALGAAWVAVGQQALVAPGPNKVAFPEHWSQGVLYATVDRPDTKQYREFYTTPDVIEASPPARAATGFLMAAPTAGSRARSISAS